jgi:hypothetical protein
VTALFLSSPEQRYTVAVVSSAMGDYTLAIDKSSKLAEKMCSCMQ